MKRRSFFATVIGGACAAIWPWKATSNEPIGGTYEMGGKTFTYDHKLVVDPEPPGWVKWWAKPDCPPPPGWGIANGMGNSKARGGTGVNWLDKFYKSGISHNYDMVPIERLDDGRKV